MLSDHYKEKYDKKHETSYNSYADQQANGQKIFRIDAHKSEESSQKKESVRYLR